MSATLYVSNLPLSATEASLATHFCKFGSVLSVALEVVTGSNRRGAFVEMKTSGEAQKAINGINLSDIDGRLVSVYRALSGAGAKQS